MTSTALSAAVRHLPLVGRPRPICSSLPERVHEINDLARAAQRPGSDVLHQAAHALNKAALLASDCGLTDDARALCWQHIDLYRGAETPLTFRQARYMLEPTTNLARLHLRDSNPQAALLILEEMHRAVTHRTNLSIDGRDLPVADLTGPPQDRNKLREWVWLQLLSDGIRALVQEHRWADAGALAAQHRGIGTHLMEGRQVAIVAALATGTPDTARDLLHASTITQPWELHIASCLEVLCCEPDHPARRRATASMIRQFQRTRPVTGYAVFRARLGLTVTDLARSSTSPAVPALLSQIADEALAAADGYAARDLLGHRIPDAHLTDQHQRALNDLISTSGLGAGPLTPQLHKTFTNSIDIATTTLCAWLQEPRHQQMPPHPVQAGTRRGLWAAPGVSRRLRAITESSAFDS